MPRCPYSGEEKQYFEKCANYIEHEYKDCFLLSFNWLCAYGCVADKVRENIKICEERHRPDLIIK